MPHGHRRGRDHHHSGPAIDAIEGAVTIRSAGLAGEALREASRRLNPYVGLPMKQSGGSEGSGFRGAGDRVMPDGSK